jgi:hypothetical protein
MKKLLLLAIILPIFNGCSSKLIPLTTEIPLSEDKATVVVYHDRFADWHPTEEKGSIPIVANEIELGKVGNGVPVITQLDPGTYGMYIDLKALGLIRRVNTFNLKANRIYYFRTYLDTGMWVSSFKLRMTSKPDKI